MTKSETIPGVVITPLQRLSDERGWLAECFRQDQIDKEIHPVMAYVSVTVPGKARGPHEHLAQTDYFCFTESSSFKLSLWDNRKTFPSYGTKQQLIVGGEHPVIVIIPPGVVHAYKNVGTKEGLVLNFPNRLYAGEGKKEKVDEVRHERDPLSPFKIE